MPSIEQADRAADGAHVGGGRERPDDRADEQRDQHADDRHDDVEVGRREAAGEDVAAEVVDAERVRRAGRLERPGRRPRTRRTG